MINESACKMPDDALSAILTYIMREWQYLKPIVDAPPPRGVWILTREPVPANTDYGMSTPVTAAWYGNADGLHERDIARIQDLWANAAAWIGTPYHRWGWVDVALLADEPVYHLEFRWGGRYGYGRQAAVTARGRVLTSSDLWRS